MSPLFKVKESQLIRQIHVYSSNVSDALLQSIFKLNDEKLSYKYYNKRITTRDNGNVQSHHKEESKLNSTITTNSGAHTHD